MTEGAKEDEDLQKILEMGLKVFRKTCILPQTVHFDYSNKAEMHDETIDVPPSKRIANTDVVPNESSPTTADKAPDSVSVRLSKWKKCDFYLPNKNLSDVMTSYKFLIEEPAAMLGEYVSNDLLNVYKESNQFVEELDSSNSQNVPFTDGKTTSFNAALGKLNEGHDHALAKKDVRLVLNLATEDKAWEVGVLQNISYVGDKDNITIREAMIGRMLGVDVYRAEQVPKHITKAAGNFLVNDASFSKESKTVTVDGGTTAPAAGDVFTVADDTQTYVIVDSASNTTTKFNFYPEVKVAWAKNAAITFKATHYVNLAFQKNAILFVSRSPLIQDDKSHCRIIPPVDEVRGLGLHLRVTEEYKRVRYAFEILYGYKVIRPEHIVRIASPEQF